MLALRPPPLSLYHRPIVVLPKDSLDRERIVSAAPVDDDASF
jgi:hypothetical protein